MKTVFWPKTGTVGTSPGHVRDMSRTSATKLVTGRLRRQTGTEGEFGCISGRSVVTISFYLLRHLVVQYLAVKQRDGKSRTSIMDC